MTATVIVDASLIARGVPAAKVHTIRNGVSPERLRPDAPGQQKKREQWRPRLGAQPTHGGGRGRATRRRGGQHGGRVRRQLRLLGTGAAHRRARDDRDRVRWTEGRNFEAVVDLMASGRLKVADLVTHRYDIDDAPKAYELIGRQLMIGFNRRWSPAVLTARNVLAGISSPKFLVYRVAAGPVPDGHWYTDRRQDGRDLGEVCHFIDTAQALIGADIEETVSVLAGDGHGRRGGDGGVVPGNDAAVSLRFSDGSLATICYGSALPKAGKEWIEVTAGRRRQVVDDFRSLKIDGKTLWRAARTRATACAPKPSASGHRRQAVAHRSHARHHPRHHPRRYRS